MASPEDISLSTHARFAGALFVNATRLRIEIELLDQAPEPPLRVRFQGDKEYEKAIEEWSTEKSEWKERIKHQMEAVAKENEKDRTIEIKNCSALLASDDIPRYFDACKRNSFLSKVTIKSGFVAPVHLLTGVLAYYDEEWDHVVEDYGRSVLRPDDRFKKDRTRKIQTFIFDCWLLWGPSIPICTCPEWHGQVALQYGYGDEDNSLTLLCSSTDIVRTLGMQNPNRAALAVRARVTGTLKWGPLLSSAGLCPAQAASWQDPRRLVIELTLGFHGNSVGAVCHS